MRKCVVGLIWLALGCQAGPPSKVVQPPLIDIRETQIRIDGDLSDMAWSRATLIHDFVEVWPIGNQSTPHLETRVWLFYAASGLYVAFRCEQDLKQQTSRLSSRDNQVERDWIRVSLDPVGKGAQAYFMELGLGGSQRDGTILAERQYNEDWDGPWVGRTAARESSWTAEMFLPWSMLSIPRHGSGEMGIHLERWVSYLGQRHSWEPLYEEDSRFLSGFSQMKVNLENRPSSWTLAPYAAADHDRLARSSKGKAGADFYWSPTTGIKISAAVFPDFGQVESDQLVVNLSSFETFFPEKRSFFLEDRDIFDTRKYKLVHTRRIGASPDQPTSLQGSRIEGLDQATDIRAALKLTGQMGNNQYGFVVVAEDDSSFTAYDNENQASTMGSSPGRNYLVGRFKHETTTRSGHYMAHGWLGSFVDRPAITRRAQVQSYDGALRDKNGKWRLNWQALASSTKQAETGENGYGAWLDGSWQPSRGNRHTLELVYFDDKIQLNDLGFLWRNDQRWAEYRFQRRQGNLTRWLERLITLNASFGGNSAGQIIRRKLVAKASFETRNRLNWKVFAENGSAPWNDRISRGNGAVRVPVWASLGFGLNTDERPRFGLSLKGWVWNEWKMRKRLSSNINLGLRFTPNDHLSLRFDGTMRNSDGRVLWLEGTRFASYELLEIIPSLRLDLLVSPRQDIRFIGQWAGVEGDAVTVFQRAADGYLEPVANVNAQLEDFSSSDLALQVRYRYELAPLSDLFAVYSVGGFYQTSQSVEQNQLSDLLTEALANKIADQFLIKIRYRF